MHLRVECSSMEPTVLGSSSGEVLAHRKPIYYIDYIYILPFFHGGGLHALTQTCFSFSKVGCITCL